MPIRAALLVGLLVLATGLPALVVSRVPDPAVARLGAAPVAAADGLATLLAWDRRRSAAYARGDPAALASLYAPGSRTGARDVDLLRSYVARGLRVRGMRTQVLAVRQVAGDRARLVVEVTDRVRGAVAVGHGTRVALPVSRPVPRRVTLLRRRGEWVVREAVPVT